MSILDSYAVGKAYGEMAVNSVFGNFRKTSATIVEYVPQKHETRSAVEEALTPIAE